MESKKAANPRWRKSLFIALPVGLVLGLPFPLLLYVSEAKDWGKGDYASYWDFAWRYWFYGALLVFAAIATIWVLCMLFFGLRDKTKARQA